MDGRAGTKSQYNENSKVNKHNKTTKNKQSVEQAVNIKSRKSAVQCKQTE